MSWLEKLLPPKIQKTEDGAERRQVPEGLWIKCPECDTVLYKTDLEGNQNVCPHCGHHHRIGARERLNVFLDHEGRYEIGQEVVPVDALKFKDSRKYPERLKEALENTGETDALIVMGGAVKSINVVAACFEFDFMGGSMGSVVGERFVRGVETAIEQKVPFICFTATGVLTSRLIIQARKQITGTMDSLHDHNNTRTISRTIRWTLIEEEQTNEQRNNVHSHLPKSICRCTVSASLQSVVSVEQWTLPCTR